MSSDSNTLAHARTREDAVDVGAVEMDTEALLITCSEVAEIGRSVRRIRVLNVLAESEKRGLEKADLAKEVARREVGADTIEDVTGKEFQRVQIGLHQSHLPKLEDAGVIEWGKNGPDEIVPGPEFDRYLSGIHALALSQGLPVDSDLGGVGDE